MSNSPEYRAALAAAIERHAAGDLNGALLAYQALCDRAAGDELLWLAYGQLLYDLGRPAEALAALIPLGDGPRAATEVWILRGNCHQELQAHESATDCYATAIQLTPESTAAWLGLGASVARQGDPAAAAIAFQHLVTLDPAGPDGYFNLGCLARAVDPEAAATWFRRALAVVPEHRGALHNLINLLCELGGYSEACSRLAAACASNPTDAPLQAAFSNVLRLAGRFAEADAAARAAIALDPALAEAHVSLTSLLLAAGQYGAARVQARAALDLVQDAALWVNLGCAEQALANPPAAQLAFLAALELAPQLQVAQSNLLLAKQYDPAQSETGIVAAHNLWGDSRAPADFVPARRSGRRLRLGYLSPDFGQHPIGFFLLPVLSAHDRQQFEVFCFSDRPVPDAMTAACQAQAEHWHSVAGLSDAALLDRLRALELDVLVDLAGHTAANRLAIFARRAAPVQVTWAGYVGTTGLATMDYLLGDPVQTPAGCDQLYRERVWRLTQNYVCYQPPADLPPLAAPPMLQAGHITFGCFNNLAKVGPAVLNLWGELLQAVPTARLLLVTGQLGDPAAREYVFEQLAPFNVLDRVQLEGGKPHAALLASYNRVDIALDPFPYAGGLTTLEALTMGVPVITRAGDRFAGRHSAAYLTSLRLNELIAADPADYVVRAAALAAKPDRLVCLRQELPHRLRQARVGQPEAFTRELEAAFRAMVAAGPARAALPKNGT